MRVLHIGKYYPPFAGGIEIFLADLLQALPEFGITPAALVHHHECNFWGAQKNFIDNKILIKRVPCWGRILYTPLSLTFPYWLQRMIQIFAPQILHLHLPNPSACVVLGLPAARKLPWVIHWQSDIVYSQNMSGLRYAYKFYRPCEQRLLAASRAVIVTSPDYLATSTALAPWHDRCRILPLGLDFNRLPDPNVQNLKHAENLWNKLGESGPRILAIGRLSYYKGHEVLIQAADLFKQARVIILGEGEKYEYLQQLINNLNLQRRVNLIGLQPAEIRNVLLATADLLCLPSLERTESFGLVLLEAMRYAKPVVASEIRGSGVTWVVRQAQHGVLVPPGDPHALAHTLQKLNTDPVRCAMLGNNGKQALISQFNIINIAQKVAELYKTI